MADQNSNRNEHAEEVREEYISTFMTYIPTPWTCYSDYDPQLIAMLEKALTRGTPVTDEDMREFFPMNDGNWY